MNTQIQLTEQELKEILAKREAAKTEEQKEYDSNVSEINHRIERDQEAYNIKNAQTEKLITELRSLDIPAELELSIEAEEQNVYLRDSLKEFAKENNIEIPTFLWNRIRFSFIDPFDGKTYSNFLDTQLERNGKISICLPYIFATSHRYYSPSTYLKKIKEGFDLRREKKEAHIRKFNNIAKLEQKLINESPEGTSIVFEKAYVHNPYSRHNKYQDIDTFKIDYPNGNQIVLKVYSDGSYGLHSKKDVTTQNWKADDWMNALKK